MGVMWFDPVYLMFALPGLALALFASVLTQSTFRKYARARASSGLTGAQAARYMLDREGLGHVTVELTRGFLSDHYDPRSNTLRLSPDVYRSDSLSAIGVACHEAGHALHQAHRYAPLAMRSSLVPVTQFGSQLAPVIILGGLSFQFSTLLNLGVLLFSAVVLFTLVTLPVEWIASARAKQAMVAAGIVTPREQPQAAAVLNAAFLTYVASAVSAVLQLLYYLSMANRRR